MRWGRDHSALRLLLSQLTDLRFPPAGELPDRTGTLMPAAEAVPAAATSRPVPVTWVHGAEVVRHFTGRAEEVARLDRWAADPQVGLVGVTAWGGAGKTALVAHWVQAGGAQGRAVFGWSFYADPSAEHWAGALIEWADQKLGMHIAVARPAQAVLDLLRALPLLLVLDGLEVMQEGPAGDGYGRLLDGILREVLTGACQPQHPGLVMLTSRFPFADLEGFDGSTARMLDMPAFTPAEGSALIAASDGDWLDDGERRKLVTAVDGHALAVGVLAGALAFRPPVSDLEALRSELTATARSDTRVSRVLQFYASRLSEPDKYIVAAVSLFAGPVPIEAVLKVAMHKAFGGSLAGWTRGRVTAAIRDRLVGLVFLHPDGRVSAHPLVRDTFSRLVLRAAQAAADTALAGLPDGKVRSRADALRAVEIAELLLTASQWKAADSLYRSRFENGQVWQHLPAARLGQRAAGAFAAPDRRDACAAHLTRHRQGFYVNSAGLHAMNAGDLATAQEYLPVAVQDCRDADDTHNLCISLRNLARCRGLIGEIGAAWEAAAEALAKAPKSSRLSQICRSRSHLGWLAAMSGDPAEAEEQFAASDQIAFTGSTDCHHLLGLMGSWWADWLASTGRTGPAQTLIRRNREICGRYGWNQDVARCDRALGRLALSGGDTEEAGQRLTAAAGCFQEGDYLAELAATLADLAEHARAIGKLDEAELHAAEAVHLARPRGLVPVQSSALAARARTCADLTAATTDLTHLARGRDAADAALRLGTRHNLAWCELDALHAHVTLDQADGTDHGWTARAQALHARLVPADLDPDPLATVERRAAASQNRRH